MDAFFKQLKEASSIKIYNLARFPASHHRLSKGPAPADQHKTKWHDIYQVFLHLDTWPLQDYTGASAAVLT